MKPFKQIFLLLLLLPVLFPFQTTAAQEAEPPVPPTPAEIINAINDLRMYNGLNPLMVHPVLMQIAQTQADGIVAGMPGHWRPNGMTLGQWMLSLGYPLSGDLSLDGYRSENWGPARTAEEAVQMWLSDDIHTNTMLSKERSDIGAGVAVNGEEIIVVIETALQTNSGKMQYDAYPILTGIPLTQSANSQIATQAAENGTLPQYSVPVGVNTAMPNGDVYHEVQYGQTLWSIAITYHTTIKQIQQLNNLYDTTVNVGQKLLVMKGATPPAPPTPVPATQSFATPTIGVIYPFTEAPSITPTIASFDYSNQDSKEVNFGVGVIIVAAIVMGGLFAAMTRKKPL